MNNNCVFPVLASFAISASFGPVLIPILRRIKCGQTVRTDGPTTHLGKNGTPTMGGMLILFSIMITCLPYIGDYPGMIPVLFVTLGFGLIGFLDDFLKVVCKSADGLTPLQKILCQLVVIVLFAYYVQNYTDISLAMRVPFVKNFVFDFGPLNLVVLVFLMLGTVNGVNFTDGLDGLAASVTMIVAVFFAVISVGMRNGLEPISCAVAGALLGFLLFNVHPASVFMGDTGSLALGGFVAASGYMMEIPLFIAIVGAVYLVEVLSVMVQVGYYKISGGKRLLRMAPLHHHFELCGFSETKIVAAFCIFTALMCLLGLKGLE